MASNNHDNKSDRLKLVLQATVHAIAISTTLINTTVNVLNYRDSLNKNPQEEIHQIKCQNFNSKNPMSD